jgi:hypothetical protein
VPGPEVVERGTDKEVLMSTHALDHALGRATATSTASRHAAWLLAGLALGFAVPAVLAELLELPRDLYYGIYAALVFGFFTLWVRTTGQLIGELVARRWRLAVALGGLGALVMVAVAIRAEEAGARAEGVTLAWQLLWRGLVYGATDGLLLAAFPVLAVFAAFAGTRLRRRKSGTVLIGVVALLASLAMTGAYHAGYSDFRSEKIAKPLAGSPVWSLPTLVTLNPIGAPIAHVGLHVSAVLHNPDSETFLPPHR